jgi:hypothetical protein
MTRYGNQDSLGKYWRTLHSAWIQLVYPRGTRLLRTMTLCFAAIAGLGACGDGIDTAEWTEEVRLSDGRMVVVWRKHHRASFGFPNARRGGLIDYELKYAPMGVHWYDKIRHDHRRDPVSFDIIDGVPHLVLEGNWDVCVGRPPTDLSAQFLKWIDGRWVDVPQAQFPVDRTPMNLLQSPWGHTTKEDARGLITWRDERKFGEGAYRREPDTVKKYFERGSRICEYNPPRVIRTN